MAPLAAPSWVGAGSSSGVAEMSLPDGGVGDEDADGGEGVCAATAGSGATARLRWFARPLFAMRDETRLRWFGLAGGGRCTL